MEVKKSEKASLNNKRLLFTEIGFVFALLVTLCAFEWTSKDKAENDWVADEQELIEEEIIPITQDNAGEQRGVRKAGAENLVNSRVGVQDVAAFLHAAVLDCGCFGKK